ncbi:hypothetical protein C8Q75DRAFT_733952 [Abortiporus biennis]|nr:hypothetical protein C8Q75DRAFT_733952 [Abortiporus biennis]
MTELLPLASTLLDQIPHLLERTLKAEVSNNSLVNQCIDLKSQIKLLEQSIAKERQEQKRIREEISNIRGSGSSACEGDRRIAEDASLSSDPIILKRSGTGSVLDRGSQVSLRTKRKGVVFSDDVRIIKRVKVPPMDVKGGVPAIGINDSVCSS